MNYLSRYLLPILSGAVIGYLLMMFLNSNPLAIISIAIIITLAVSMGLKNTSPNEIITMAKRIVGKK